MVETLNLIGGSGIIVLNLIPFILRRPNLLFLTAFVSFIILFLVAQFG